MSQAEQPISRPPTGTELFFNRFFRGSTKVSAWVTILSVVFIVGLIAYQSLHAIEKYKFDFFTGKSWDPGKETFGILPEIWGTLYSSILGVGLGSLFGVAVAIFLTQDFLPAWLAGVFKNIIELLAAIPSVVYGLWGIFVVIPAIRPTCDWLHDHLGWIPHLRHAAARASACCRRRWCWPSWCCRRSRPSRATPSAPCQSQAARGGLRPGRDPLGDDPGRRPADRVARHLRLDHARLRPGARRDDGPGHAGRQHQRHRLVGLLAGEHPGGPAGQQVPRGVGAVETSAS